MIELGGPVLGEAEKQALAEVVDDRWLTMGERVRRFERAFAEMHGAADAVAVSSATAALQLILAAFDIGPGDEVLVPSMSFVATASVVVHAGARPVFVDVEAADRPHLSLEGARAAITPRTRAIILMHYGGYVMDVPAWRRLADEHGLVLVEDAAHVAGLPLSGARGDAAAYSFFSNKNMTTAEGGMVVVADEERRERVRLLRSHAMTASTLDRDRGRAVGYDVIACGHNFRMDELRAAVGLVQLGRLAEGNEARRQLAKQYRAGLAERLPRVAVPFDAAHPTSGHIMPVLLPAGADRAGIMHAMRGAGVQTSVHYPSIHRFTYYRETLPPVTLPRTESFSERELTLPLHPGLEPDDVERVVSALARALGDV